MIEFFSMNPGSITDFAPIPTHEIASRFFSSLDENKKRLEKRSNSLEAASQLSVGDSENFVSKALSQRTQAQSDEIDYNAPVQLSKTINKPQENESIKLSNYGYDSDSSPDHNSNVLKIGHANNALEDGLSAALTKSLAKRYGLKTGDFFEAVTADGKVMKRRYDDTVPTKYKGKSLPETVDLYERKGSNSFSGKVVQIKPLK